MCFTSPILLPSPLPILSPPPELCSVDCHQPSHPATQRIQPLTGGSHIRKLTLPRPSRVERVPFPVAGGNSIAVKPCDWSGGTNGRRKFEQRKISPLDSSFPLPSLDMPLLWASLQDFIPASNCRSQLPFPTAPELLALVFCDVNYSTHGLKWVRSRVARCRITSVS